MDPERLDLSALDPTADAERWERLISAITVRAAPELARRAALASPFAILVSWSRPMLSAAATLAVISTAALLTMDGVAPPTVIAGGGVVEALSVPAPASAWLAEERAPTVDDLILAVEGENP